MDQKITAEMTTDKIFELTEQFNRYVFDHPEVLDHIPDKAVLVFLDAHDPVFNKANLELADAAPTPPDSQRVYIKMRKHIHLVEQVDWEAEVVLAA